MEDHILDARELPLYHCIKLSQSEAYIVVHQLQQGKLSKVWKKYDPSGFLKEEDYIMTTDHGERNIKMETDLCYLLNTKGKAITGSTTKISNLSRYQQFIKMKIDELSSSHKHLTKKERYVIALEEWRKTK